MRFHLSFVSNSEGGGGLGGDIRSNYRLKSRTDSQLNYQKVLRWWSMVPLPKIGNDFPLIKHEIQLIFFILYSIIETSTSFHFSIYSFTIYLYSDWLAGDTRQGQTTGDCSVVQRILNFQIHKDGWGLPFSVLNSIFIREGLANLLKESMKSFQKFCKLRKHERVFSAQH